MSAFIEELGEELRLSPSLVMSINLAIEEAIANIIQYAYPVGSTTTISLLAEHKDNEFPSDCHFEQKSYPSGTMIHKDDMNINYLIYC